MDSEIRALRHSFLVALRDTFGIGLVRPDDWNDLPLHAQIDLGRGNTVVPYVVNHLSNQRALLKVLPDDGVEQLGLDSRMHEGGFRLLVGSSGLDTSAQHLPFGSLILQGVYVIENGSNGNTDYLPIKISHDYGPLEYTEHCARASQSGIGRRRSTHPCRRVISDSNEAEDDHPRQLRLSWTLNENNEAEQDGHGWMVILLL